MSCLETYPDGLSPAVSELPSYDARTCFPDYERAMYFLEPPPRRARFANSESGPFHCNNIKYSRRYYLRKKAFEITRLHLHSRIS